MNPMWILATAFVLALAPARAARSGEADHHHEEKGAAEHDCCAHEEGGHGEHGEEDEHGHDHGDEHEGKAHDGHAEKEHDHGDHAQGEHGEHGKNEHGEHGKDEHGKDEHGHGHEERRQFTVEDFVRSGVRLVEAGPGNVDVAVELPGDVRANGDRLAHVAPRFRGIVREARRSVGETVRAGEVLAIVESEHLSTFEIRAPFDGTVLDKHIVPGETASPESPAYVIADLSTVWVLLRAYPQALPFVRPGRPVRIASRDVRGEVEARVAFVSPVVEEETRMATARVVLANPDGKWPPGLFVTATIEDPVHASVVGPRRAVHDVDGHPAVFVTKGDRLEPRRIETGTEGRTTVEVRSGLEAGERVADERSFLVKAELLKREHAHEH